MKLDTQRLWLYEMEQHWSAKNSEHYYVTKLWDNQNGYTYITYLSEENYNMYNWRDVLEHYNKSRAVCMSGNFKTARGKTHIINADCKPKYEGSVSITDFCDLVYSAWASDIDPALNGSQRIIDLTTYFD